MFRFTMRNIVLVSGILNMYTYCPFGTSVTTPILLKDITLAASIIAYLIYCRMGHYLTLVLDRYYPECLIWSQGE